MIRPAVEAALEVARMGLLANPPVDPPSGLRPYLGFAKLSPAVLRAIAHVVDGDEEFRARVAAEAQESDVGRAGWLWLNRPEGWSDEVALLQRDAAAEASAAAAERSERSARRKLKAARDAADKAAAKARARAEEADKLRSDVADERARRSAAQQDADRLAAELRQAIEERARAVRELKEVEARLDARAAEAKRAAARVRELEAELAQAGESAAAPAEDVSDVDPRARVALADALRQTADGARSLGEALGELAGLLDQASGRDTATTDRRGETAGETGGETAGETGGGTESGIDTSAGAPDAEGARRAAPVRPGWEPPEPRVPITLPGGVVDDSIEAALCLLRTPGVLVLVDGYNVTMVAWSELPIAEQRARLLSALDEAAARSGADVEVIFDGAEPEPPMADAPSGRNAVRKRFSPPDIEADDELLNLLAQIPTTRPVVVVSSDNRVREGARRHGANLIHARQMMELLRR